MLKRVAWLFFACAIVVAVVKSVPHGDTTSLMDWARGKAEQVQVWSDNTTDTIVDGTENLPEPGGILPETSPAPTAPPTSTPASPPPTVSESASAG